MTASLFDQIVLPLFEEHRSDWLENARAAARRLARTRREITINDVRAECPPPDHIDPRVMGAVFRPAKDWQLVRYERSNRTTCHNRPVGVFRFRGAR
jgi:hypothetical protein